MRKNRGIATILLAALASFALLATSGVVRAEEVDLDIPGNVEAGKKVYEKHCHFCHGRGGRGDGPVGIAVTPHPADFIGDKKRMKKSDQELLDSITNGVTKELGGDEMAMPAWKGILTPTERRDVLAYIRYLSKTGKK